MKTCRFPLRPFDRKGNFIAFADDVKLSMPADTFYETAAARGLMDDDDVALPPFGITVCRKPYFTGVPSFVKIRKALAV